MKLTEAKLAEILAHVQQQLPRLDRAKDLLNIYEGQLLSYIEDAMRQELNEKAFERSRKRIAPINILPKVIKKVASIYNSEVKRKVDASESSAHNEEIADYYMKEIDFDLKGLHSDQQYSINEYTALEPFLDEKGKPQLRVLPANQFTVYSDDILDPTKVTAFIKILGKRVKNTGEFNNVTDMPFTKEVLILAIYTDEDSIIVDSDGEFQNDLMKNNIEGINPYGIIPFIYITNAQFQTLPTEDTDTKQMVVLLPLLLTDLNYATQFMSHSIIYAIDAELEEASGNPDSIWLIKSDESDDESKQKTASIGTIKPEVDIDKVLTLVQTQLALWLDSKQINSKGIGSVDTANFASGISKMIDEADTTNAKKEHINIYKVVERNLFKLIGIMHNVWVQNQTMTEMQFLVDKELLVHTTFIEPKALADPKIELELIKLKQDARYTTRNRAIAEANPNMDIDELALLIEEIDAEQTEMITIEELSNEEDNRETTGNTKDNKETNTDEEGKE